MNVGVKQIDCKGSIIMRFKQEAVLRYVNDDKTTQNFS